MNKVYVVQNQFVVSPTGALEPRFDLTSAAAFGELVTLLPPTASAFDTESALKLLRKGLAKFTGDDYLLLIGNPALLGLATAVAARNNNGKVRILQWQHRERKYFAVECKI